MTKTAHILIQVVVFWVVAPCSDVLGYQHFTGLCYFNLQGICTGLHSRRPWLESSSL